MKLSGGVVIPLTLILFPLLSWLPLPTSTVNEPLSAQVERRYDEGRLEEREGLLILHLKGTPYEMGYQHGFLLRHEIREGLRERIYERLILEEGISHLLLLRHAHRVDAYLPSEYREEMRGLADGAGISYSDVLLLNSFRDLISQPSSAQEIRDLLLAVYPPFVPPFGSVDMLASTDSSPEASSGGILSLPLETAFAAFGRATEDGKLLHGVDFASPEPSLGDVLLIVYQPRAGNTFVALAWPGAVGVTIGLNEEKISVAELASLSRDVSLEGAPLPFLLRDVLEYAGDIPTALRLIASAERTVGNNVVIGDGKPADAQAMEVSAHLYSIFEAEDDLIIRANHYLDPTLSESRPTSSQREYESSQARLEAIYEGLETDYGHVDLSGVVNLLGESHTVNEEEQESVFGIVIASSDLEIWVLSVVQRDGGVLKRSLRLDEEL